MLIILYCFLGAIFWTFVEYILHRFLGHVHRGKNFFKAEHSLHHQRAHYFAPAYKKLVLALIVLAGLTALLGLVLPLIVALPFVAGFVIMYGFYELAHKRYHTTDPLVAPFIILRKHHFYHHFHNPKLNHGVTTRIWDRIFRTFHEPDQVRVPRKMAMDWQLNGEEIKPKYAKHFFLR